ncbi:hypothetical protein CEXT_783181 [Caerostris extrusa]|uniref:Uncharacterized protein n=1 Tax=Caerostris extrusa TaxID=172846 RepID=A0AAV4XZT7_CAEEX|nr:hypothetical protein CEXT_783181 [Caerostris extrusa]
MEPPFLSVGRSSQLHFLLFDPELQRPFLPPPQSFRSRGTHTEGGRICTEDVVVQYISTPHAAQPVNNPHLLDALQPPERALNMDSPISKLGLYSPSLPDTRIPAFFPLPPTPDKKTRWPAQQQQKPQLSRHQLTDLLLQKENEGSN